MSNASNLMATMNKTLINQQDQYEEMKDSVPKGQSNPFLHPEVKADNLINAAKQIADKEAFLEKHG